MPDLTFVRLHDTLALEMVSLEVKFRMYDVKVWLKWSVRHNTDNRRLSVLSLLMSVNFRCVIDSCLGALIGEGGNQLEEGQQLGLQHIFHVTPEEREPLCNLGPK